MKIYYYIRKNEGVLLCVASSKEEALNIVSKAITPTVKLTDIHEQQDDLLYVCNDGWVHEVKMVDDNVS